MRLNHWEKLHGRDTAGFRMIAKIMAQYADKPEKATAHRQLAVLANRFPEYSPLLQKARKLIDGGNK